MLRFQWSLQVERGKKRNTNLINNKLDYFPKKSEKRGWTKFSTNQYQNRL